MSDKVKTEESQINGLQSTTKIVGTVAIFDEAKCNPYGQDGGSRREIQKEQH